jgi:xylulose-5-phosphate/fructose-6-phosphate phosphoketolase
VRREMRDKLIEHREHVHRYGEDLAEVKDWTWQR